LEDPNALLEPNPCTGCDGHPERTIALKAQEETMKATAADPQTTQKILAIAKAYDEAVNQHDPAAIAALYTEDAAFVTDRGPVQGRQAIEQWYTDLFQGWQPKNHLTTIDPECPRLVGTAGEVAWETGGWSETGQGPSGEPIQLKGHWGAMKVRQGEGWKIQMLAANVAVEPAATPSLTITRSNP
jgi:uncharacterized protein (TIGR02246 family)